MVAHAWLLNLDADDELGRPRGYTPSRAVLARSRALVERVGPLLGPNDVLVTPETTLPRDVFMGRAWCPTPSAERALERAGARKGEAPSLEILRRCNHRAFSAELGPTLPGAVYIKEWPALERAVNAPSPMDEWLLKRPFGFAGRGRKKLRRGAIDAATRAWIEASLATGEGLEIVPWVERDADHGLHGFLAPSGDFTLGEPTMQHVDETGAWIATERAAAGALAADERLALLEAATRATGALRAAGYFGPFGIDAFRWIDRDGARRFCALSEINARYSMGWAIGMGERRPDREI